MFLPLAHLWRCSKLVYSKLFNLNLLYFETVVPNWLTISASFSSTVN